MADSSSATQELDTAYALPGVSRFRVNVYRQRGAVGAVLRAIPHQIRSLDELGLPQIGGAASPTCPAAWCWSPARPARASRPPWPACSTWPTRPGPATSSPSRTRSSTCTGTARAWSTSARSGSDTADFAVALKHVLRQDPDIILVGELRDLETTSVAVTAAETGHLVLATLHTQSAAQTIDRLIDIYPPHQQQQIRAQLANCLQGVVTQALAPRKDGMGRTIVCEIMVATAAIRNLIREGKVHQIPSFLQSSSDVGMISFDQHLAQRYTEQLISKNTALELAHDPNEFKRLARGCSTCPPRPSPTRRWTAPAPLTKGRIDSDVGRGRGQHAVGPEADPAVGRAHRRRACSSDIKIPGFGGKTDAARTWRSCPGSSPR